MEMLSRRILFRGFCPMWDFVLGGILSRGYCLGRLYPDTPVDTVPGHSLCFLHCVATSGNIYVDNHHADSHIDVVGGRTFILPLSADPAMFV